MSTTGRIGTQPYVMVTTEKLYRERGYMDEICWEIIPASRLVEVLNSITPGAGTKYYILQDEKSGGV